METLMGISAVIGLANIGILTALLVIYGKVYKNTKAIFTIGLIFFAGLLMLHNIIAVYAYFAMEQLYSIGLLPYFVGVHIAELAGLLILFRVTLL
jgi:hypothetical protein